MINPANVNPQTEVDTTMRKILLFCVPAALVCFVAVGCAGKTQLQPDPFFEEWRLKAAESQGFSPDQELEAIDVDEFVAEMEPEIEEIPEPPLPTTMVSLQLRDVPISVLLQALSRAVNQNIVSPAAVHEKNVNANLDNVPWDQAFRSILAVHGLAYTWEGDILRVMTVDDMEHELRVAQVRKARAEKDRQIERAAPLVTRILRISYADPAALSANLQKLITRDAGDAEGQARGFIVVDQHSNSLVVKAARDDQERILNMVRHLDQPRAQVLIQATIVEATKDTARDLGIQWGGRLAATIDDRPWMLAPGVGGPAGDWPDGDPATPIFNVGQGPGGMAANFPADPAGLNLGFIVGGARYLEVQLSALQRDGKLNILSSPSITTLDNQMAFAENGERVPFVTIDDGERTVRFEDAVLRLEITPSTIGGDLLKIKVSVKKDEVDFSRSVDGNPLIIKKQTETNLVVASGETIVISGLTQRRDFLSEGGVPWLKDVQGLGWLFKRQDRLSRMEEVLIFITPTILPPRHALNRKSAG